MDELSILWPLHQDFSDSGPMWNNIGIKHGFSCINVCQVPREVLKTEAEGLGFSTSSEGPGKR